MKTFRVEFNAAGHVTSCIELDRVAPDSVTIVYVQATSADAAKAKAEKIRQRIRQRARRAGYRAQGLCPDCGRQPTPGRIKCETCLLSNRISDRARQKSEKLRETRATREQQERLATLLEVRRALDEHGPAFIARWLDEAIEELTGRERSRAA